MQERDFKRFACAMAVTIVCGWLAGASGQEPFFADTDPAYDTANRPPPGHLISTSAAFADLDARLRALETASAEDAPADAGWTDVSAEKFSVKVGGRVFADYVMFAGQDAASVAAYDNLQNYWEFRNIRLFAEGKGYGVFDYKLEVDLSPESGQVADDDASVEMQDLYMGIHEVPYLGYVRMGHFKEPFSLEELTSPKYITFMERAAPNIFVPKRHFGICAYNHSENEEFTWAYGTFFDGIPDVDAKEKQYVDDAQGINLALRGTWCPIYTANGRGVLHLGAGYVWADDRDNLVQFRSRFGSHEGGRLIDTGAFDADNYHRLNTELAMVYGPFSLQSELFYVQTNGIAGVPDIDFYGAYVYGSYFLTGENRVYNRTAAAFGRVKPVTNFWIVRTADGRCSGPGAWELTCRWGYLDLDDPYLVGNPLAGQLNGLTVGVNWYWNPYMRLMLDWGHAFSNVNATPDTANTDVIAMRMQFDF